MNSKSKIHLELWQISQLSQAALNMNCVEACELTDGWANTLYKIHLENGINCVLKISPPPSCPVMRYEKDLLYTEAEVLRMLAKHGIPVPEVYAFLEANAVINHPCFFMEYIEGTTLSSLLQNTDVLAERKHEIEHNLGELQANINNIGENFDFWGSITGRGHRFNTWQDCFSSMIHDLILDAEEAQSNTGFRKGYIQSRINTHLAALDINSQPALVLWDLHDGNIIMSEGDIRAVIDCDRSFAGDPLMEFWFRNLAGDRGILQKSYMNHINHRILSPLSSEVALRNKLYDLYLSLVMRIECDFRNYADDHVSWTQNRLREAVSALS